MLIHQREGLTAALLRELGVHLFDSLDDALEAMPQLVEASGRTMALYSMAEAICPPAAYIVQRAADLSPECSRMVCSLCLDDVRFARCDCGDSLCSDTECEGCHASTTECRIIMDGSDGGPALCSRCNG